METKISNFVESGNSNEVLRSHLRKGGREEKVPTEIFSLLRCCTYSRFPRLSLCEKVEGRRRAGGMHSKGDRARVEAQTQGVAIAKHRWVSSVKVGLGKWTAWITRHSHDSAYSFMRRPDPFYEVHRRTENGEGFIDWELVYRSTKITDNSNPVWPSVAIDTFSLGDGNLNHPIKIILFHHKKDGNNENIGEVLVSVNRLIDASTEGNDDPSRALSLTLIKSKTSKIKTGKLVVLQAYIRGANDTIEEMAGLRVRRGSVVVENAKKGPNFMDYVIKGCYFKVVLAVDFSGSNGDPNKPGTLHYLDPSGGFNDYEKPMIGMLSILGQLDTDNHFALWGFGAKYNDDVHNVFQCGTSRLIRGTEGVLQAYRDQFRSGITMANSPTVFTDVIRMAAARAERDAEIAEKFEKQVYTILCIFTGRDVEFIEDTAAALDEATSTPLSVVFVGIGDGDFFNMRFIDHGREMRNVRDIAHFVAFNEHSKDSQAFTSEACQAIPQQVTDFFESKGIAHLPDIELSDDDLIRMPAEVESDVVIHLTKEHVPILKEGGIEYRDFFRDLIGADDK